MKLLIIMFLIFLVFGFYYFYPFSSDEGDIVDLTCYDKHNVVFYGTSWCSFCQTQRDILGDLLSDITYVDCDVDYEVCELNQINAYPTWSFNGTIVKGVLTFEEFLRFSGCD